MITSENLVYTYKNGEPLVFPNITCDKGQTLLITGGSGVGKTTLLHVLGGLLRPQKGEVSIDNVNFSSLSERQLDAFRGSNVGLVLQESHFIASLSVRENIEVTSWLATGKKSNQIASVLQQLGLKNQQDKLPSQLSVGQQQRVSIARALINNPKLLLADEPTSSLDDENAFIVADLLSQLAKQFGTALIIVTHDQRLKDRFQNSISL